IKLPEDQAALSTAVGQTAVDRTPSVSDYVASVARDTSLIALAKNKQDRPSDNCSKNRFSTRERTRGKSGWEAGLDHLI
ncbi:hypothetical protein BG011_003585, partial [Mortierella polycephala]